MNLRRLKWTGIVLPLAFLAIVGVVQHFVIEPLLPSPLDYVVLFGVLAMGVSLFSHGVFKVVSKIGENVFQRNKELSTLNTVASTVALSLDANDVIVPTLDKVLELTGMDVGEICLWDEATGCLFCAMHRGLYAKEFTEISQFKLGEDFPGIVAKSGQPLVTYDLAHDKRFLRESVKKRGFQVLVCVPLKSRGKIVGTLDIASRHLRKFTPQDLELLESVGSQIGTALENIKLYSEATSQSEKLRSLNEAGISMTSELSLEGVLQKVVDLSRNLVKARYAALGVLNEEGKIGPFVVSGMDPEKAALIGAPPKGAGLLGILLSEGKPLRIRDIVQDPRAAGFPAAHPHMKSYLGVPIILKGKVIGNLYLTDKEQAEDFSQEDEEAVSILATQAAIAIENARLYQQVQNVAVLQERDRIAREMHDGLAQTLGYLNLEIDHMENLLSSNQDGQVETELEKMRKVVRQAYSDVRESIVGLRAAIDLDANLRSSLEGYLSQFTENSGIQVELSADGVNLSRLQLSSQIQMIRIAQEALTNVRKHAQAKQARITFEAQDGNIKLVIEDDGCGFDPATITRPGQHFGLHIMRERAESLGGTFDVQSSLGRGTRVIAHLPVSHEKDGTYGENTASPGG